MNEITPHIKIALARQVLDSLRETVTDTLGEIDNAYSAVETTGVSASRISEMMDNAAVRASAHEKRLFGKKCESLALRDMIRTGIPESDCVAIGALIQIDSKAGTDYYFFLPSGGGTVLHHEAFGDEELVVITPQSPLAQALLNKKTGSRINFRQKALHITAIR